MDSDDDDRVEEKVKIKSEPVDELPRGFSSNSRRINIPRKKPKGPKYKKNHVTQVNFNNALRKFIFHGFQSSQLVEDPQFTELVECCNPKLDIPSQLDLSNRVIPKVYGDALSELECLLNDATSIAVSLDTWTWRGSSQYVTVISHFIDSSFHANRFALGTVELLPTYSPERIAGVISNIFEQRKIRNKVHLILSESTERIVAAGQLLKCVLLPCYGYTLNEILLKAFTNGIDQIFTSCLKFIEFVTNYSIANPNNVLVRPEQLMYSSKRWDAVLEAVEEILYHHNDKLKDVLEASSKENKLSMALLFDLESLAKILKPFVDLMEDFSTQSYVSVALLLSSIQHLKPILQVTSTDSRPIKKIKETILSELQKSFLDDHVLPVLEKAAFLDPRFKNFDIFNKDMLKYQLKEELIDCINQDKKKTGDDDIDEIIICSVATPKPKRKKAGEFAPRFLKQAKERNSGTSAKTAQTVAADEISRYDFMSPIELNDEPLEFWNDNRRNYPYLSILAKKYLAIPITRVPAERLFTDEGALVNAKRSLLLQRDINMTTFLNENQTLYK